MELNDLIKTVQPYTMASKERLRWKAEIAQQIIRENIPGDFVECGVWNGGSAAIQAHYTTPAGRRMYLFDSFEGMPKPSANDIPNIGGVTSESEIGKCVGDIEKVKEVMRKVQADLSKVIVYKGWFEDTFEMPSTKLIDPIAMLNLDSDWYDSELLCWETFFDRVVPGGYIYIDDWSYWPGTRQAAVNFWGERLITPTVHEIGHSCWIQKGER